MDLGKVPIVVGLIVLGTLFVAGVTDVWLGGTYGEQATISHSIQRWCQRWPVLYIALAWLLFHVTQVPCSSTETAAQERKTQ